MAYDRWTKRMDDAVASTWLRGLRSQGRERPASSSSSSAQRLLQGAPRGKSSLRSLDRPIAAER